VPLALVAVLVAVGGARAQPKADDGAGDADASTARWTLRGELGGEIDTNAHRTERVNAPDVTNPPIVVSPLARGVLSGSLTDVVGAGHQVAFSATLAGKVFTNSEARSEDVGIAESTGFWRAPLGARSSLMLAAAYYEAFQRDRFQADYSTERRDFRSVTPTLRVARVVGEAELALGAGYRTFVFKPDHTYDFQGPTAAFDARWARETADGAAEWDALFRLAYERRAFESLAFVEGSGGCITNPFCPPTSGTALRRDDFITTGVEASRTGRVLMAAGYALHLNLSNSFGETIIRHFGIARFAAELPWDFYLAARIEILVARYTDGIIVAQNNAAQTGRPFITIEDENRNSARAELSRNVGDRLQLALRYTFYANELGSNDSTYSRHTALLTCSFTLEK
jgi:hypothetical protein